MGSTPQLRHYGHQRNVVNHQPALAPFLFLSLPVSRSRLLSLSLFVLRDGPFSPSLRRGDSLYRVLLRSTVTLNRPPPVPRSPRRRTNLHPPRAEASCASASARSVSRQDRGAWRLRAPLPVVPDVTTPPLVQHSGYVTLLTAIIKVFTRVPPGRSPPSRSLFLGQARGRPSVFRPLRADSSSSLLTRIGFLAFVFLPIRVTVICLLSLFSNFLVHVGLIFRPFSRER